MIDLDAKNPARWSGARFRERTSLASWTRSHGYEPTPEAAMAAFAKGWRRQGPR
jgi:hypothetical protein